MGPHRRPNANFAEGRPRPHRPCPSQPQDRHRRRTPQCANSAETLRSAVLGLWRALASDTIEKPSGIAMTKVATTASIPTASARVSVDPIARTAMPSNAISSRAVRGLTRHRPERRPALGLFANVVRPRHVLEDLGRSATTASAIVGRQCEDGDRGALSVQSQRAYAVADRRRTAEEREESAPPVGAAMVNAMRTATSREVVPRLPPCGALDKRVLTQ